MDLCRYLTKPGKIAKAVLSLLLLLSLIFFIPFCGKKEKTEKEISKKDTVDLVKNIGIDLKSNVNYIMPRPTIIFEILKDWNFNFGGIVGKIPDKTNYKTYDRRALNLGMRGADGLFLYFAENLARGEKVAGDMILIAKSLGIEREIDQSVRKLQNSIRKKQNHKKVLEELDNTFATVENILRKSTNNELAILVSLGGWIESFYLVSMGFKKNYNRKNSRIISQPEVIDIYLKSIEPMKNLFATSGLITTIVENLLKLKKIDDDKKGKFLTLDDIQKIYIILKFLKSEIEKNN